MATKSGRKKEVKKRGQKSISERGLIISEREEEILSHLREGKTYAKVAVDLFISVETVRKHAHQLYKRLGVRNKTEAVNKFFGK